MKKNKVILDTNFLLVPYQYCLDIFTEIDFLIGSSEFVISKGILNELKEISKRKAKAGLAARFALKMIDKNKHRFNILSSVEPADKWIFEYAKKYSIPVATNDREILRNLKYNKIKAIVVKSRSRLDLV